MRFAKLVPTLGVVGIVAIACGGGGTSSNSPTATIPSSLSVSSFDVTFSAMATLKDLHAAGSGLVGVLMPDTTSSTRWVNSDLPYLTKAFQMAGYSSSDFKIDNAQGNDATELAQAQADITQGAKVLVMAPNDSTVGTQIQALASSKGVKLISYTEPPSPVPTPTTSASTTCRSASSSDRASRTASPHGTSPARRSSR